MACPRRFAASFQAAWLHVWRVPDLYKYGPELRSLAFEPEYARRDVRHFLEEHRPETVWSASFSAYQIATGRWFEAPGGIFQARYWVSHWELSKPQNIITLRRTVSSSKCSLLILLRNQTQNLLKIERWKPSLEIYQHSSLFPIIIKYRCCNNGRTGKTFREYLGEN